MKTKTFIHERTQQCIALKEVTPVRFIFLGDEVTLSELRSCGWKPSPDPGYRGMPNPKQRSKDD